VRATAWRRWGSQYVGALAITCVCTLIALPFYPSFDPVNIVMLYLLGTTVCALGFGRGPSSVQAVANILAFDYFFVPPRFSLDVEDVQYLFTMSVMLAVALVIGHLMVSIRHHRDLAETRERRTAVLYAMSRELAVAADVPSMVAAAIRHFCADFHSEGIVLLADDQGRLEPVAPTGGTADLPVTPTLTEDDLTWATKTMNTGQRQVGSSLYLPLEGARGLHGVIIVRPHPPDPEFSSEHLELLDAFAAQLALSLQRAAYAESAQAARLSAERALLRNTLLTSISHDLRTPLAAIAGAGSLLAQPDSALNADRRTTLGHLIERKARDMSQLLSNVLELVQMEFGSGTLRADWQVIEELVTHALRTNEARLSQCRVRVDLSDELPLIWVDPTLIVQILCNLLDNAVKYTPPGTTLTVSARSAGENVTLVVADDGPGLPPGDPEQLFEKFHRGRPESNIGGVGLGLAICRAAARLHGGDIRASDNLGGGARFEITLPVGPAPAANPPDESEPVRRRA